MAGSQGTLLHPGFITQPGRAITSQLQAIARPATRLQQFSLRHIGQVHDQTRHKIDEVRAAITFISEDLADAKGLRAQLQAIAQLEPQRAQNARLHPHFAARRHAPGLLAQRFIKLASYKGTKSTGNVITSIGLDIPLTDRHVVIIEDIVDTGKTLHEFLPQLVNQQPASLKIAALLHKPDALVHPLLIDYIGFNVPNKFLLGFGLDYDGLGRNLKEIYQLVED